MASVWTITTFDFTQFNAFHSAASSHTGLNYSRHDTSMLLSVLMHMNGKRIWKSTFPVTIYKVLGLSLFGRLLTGTVIQCASANEAVNVVPWFLLKWIKSSVTQTARLNRLQVQIWDCTVVRMYTFSLYLLGSLNVLQLPPTVHQHACGRIWSQWDKAGQYYDKYLYYFYWHCFAVQM